MKTLVRLTAFVCLLAGVSFAQNAVFNVTSSNTAVTATTAGFSAILKENSGSPTATFDVYDPSLSASPVHIGAGGIYVFTRERGYPFVSANVLGYVKQTNGAGPTAFVLEQVSSSAITYQVTNNTGGGGAVSSVFTRTGDVVAQTGDYTATQVGLGSVTNDVQTKAAIVPNTAPSAGQVPIGNAGGTAYLKQSFSGDCTLASTGAITCTKTGGVSFASVATSGSKSDVGLDSVDNTSDAGKPVSTAQQTALDLKAPLASPTFTGTVSGITKSMVGLGSVDNTSDAGKPVSTAQQTALDLKANLASPTIVTPTIASFVNATHSHQNAAGGGSLDAAAIGSGSLATARGGFGSANVSVTDTGAALATPAAPSITPSCSGTCVSTWGYKCVALNSSGHGIATAEGTTAANATTIDGSHTNSIACPSVTGSTSCSVYRTTTATSPSTKGIIGTMTCGGTALVDNGLAGDGTNVSVTNTTGGVVSSNGFSGSSAAPQGLTTAGYGYTVAGSGAGSALGLTISSAAIVSSANNQDAIQFTQMITQTVGHITCEVTGTGGGSTHWGVAIYDSAKNLIGTTGAQDFTALNGTSVASAFTLHAGEVYWFYWTADSSTGTMRLFSQPGGNSGNVLNKGALSNLARFGQLVGSSSGGVPPATMGSIGTTINNNPPFCLLEP